ncbi:4'-phosphopantetheinyl transferase superfamily protein [uncultured Microbulbifer sp.]|uniref:4'-phosphopantetheinyl transferase family protein n=1 Tax=uncultured Microbulbifer sp. TaxID=348147 RepID=UPI0026381507|nr:4'-phosphopantetheinyl transferase superfamily protein [uncultured Microbulbifer sp.]
MIQFTCSSFIDWSNDWQSISSLLLSSAEHTRLESIRRTSRKKQFLAGRLLARTLLAEQFGCFPQELELDANRPSVAYLAGAPLANLSISHTSDYLAVTVSKAPIGIDCERSYPIRNWLDIAQNYFSSYEVSWLRQQPAHLLEKGFMSIWTAKEALAKCSGHDFGKLLAVSSPVGERENWPEPYSSYRCWQGKTQESTYLCLVVKPNTNFTPSVLTGTYRTSFDDRVTREIRLRAMPSSANPLMIRNQGVYK